MSQLLVQVHSPPPHPDYTLVQDPVQAISFLLTCLNSLKKETSAVKKPCCGGAASGQQGMLQSTVASQSWHNHTHSSTATVKAPLRDWPKTVSSSEREVYCPCLVPLADYSDSVDSPQKGPGPQHLPLMS